MKTQRILLAGLLGILVSAVHNVSVHAMDTDVYLKSQSLAARQDNPNVMIILDNSGSMDTIVTTHPAYNPAVNYCTADLNALYPTMLNPNAGKPSNCATISAQVFWSFSGSAPATT